MGENFRAIAGPIITLILIGGCAAHTRLEPLGEGEVAANVSFGGPIVAAFDTYVPMPYLTAGASYGMSDQLDVTATMHLLSLYFAIAGLDLGATWYPVANDGAIPSVGIGPRLMTFASLKSDVEERFRIYPMLSGSAAWMVPGGMAYTGLDLLVPFSTSDYDPGHPSLLISPFAGYRWRITETLGLHAELKWQAANVAADKVSADYTTIGENGALAPLIALEWLY